MSINFAVAPDIPIQKIASWHLLVNYLQKHSMQAILAQDFMDFAEQREALQKGEIGLIYASSFDARLLLDLGFLPIARPKADADEITIVTYIEHQALSVEDLSSNIKISATDNPDLRQLGLILLEPANLNRTNTSFILAKNHILTIKDLLKQEVDLAIIPTKTYQNLSPPVKNSLRALVANSKDDIAALTHVFLLHKEYAARLDSFKNILTTMPDNSSGKSILDDLELTGFTIIDDVAQLDFMIDLVDALQI